MVGAWKRVECGISKFANSFQRIGRLAHVWDTGARIGLLPDAGRLIRMHWDPLGSIGMHWDSRRGLRMHWDTGAAMGIPLDKSHLSRCIVS